jgi:CRISPR-associated protein Cas2
MGYDEYPRRYLATYDIPSDATRAVVAKTLKGYGQRVQFSVFECWLTERELRRLLREVSKLIDDEVDDVRVFLLGGRPEGSPPLDRAAGYWVA